jgi:hypothetical protein
MKKLLSLITMFVIICTTLTVISEEQPQFSIAEAIRSFMLVNNPVALENLTTVNNTFTLHGWETEADKLSHGHYPLSQEILDKLDKYYVDYAIVPESSFFFYYLNNSRYSKQYAEYNNFDILLGKNKIWNIKTVNGTERRYYDEDLKSCYLLNGMISDKETISFLQNPDLIEQMVKDDIEEQIVDCKIAVFNLTAIIYLKGISTDYGIKLYESHSGKEELAYLENFKIYKMSELLQSYTEYKRYTETEFRNRYIDKILNQKPTYETEMELLKEDGLLQGTDKGLEPLKPLTRIEATTLLVRALGYEDEPTSATSKFEDIPNGNWGVKYANIAADKGITQGVGGNKFAPDDLVTDNQFATLVLRSSGEQQFDWETAIQTLIDREIITQEQADTMDLFTRGDMAKIIYEARQKGLIN